MALKVSFTGLGTMGSALANNVLQAGFDLMVYDVREEQMKDLIRLGAKAGSSPAEVGVYGDIIETAVVDDAPTEAVALGGKGILDRVKSGSVILLHTARSIPRQCGRSPRRPKPKASASWTAQMSGGQAGARAKKLCFMVGGDKSDFEKCRPVLSASAGPIIHVGEVGIGAMAKLAQQTITCLNRTARLRRHDARGEIRSRFPKSSSKSFASHPRRVRSPTTRSSIIRI